jgi:hypothetical protein
VKKIFLLEGIAEVGLLCGVVRENRGPGEQALRTMEGVGRALSF